VHGKPTILVEIGENGRRDPAFVEPIVSGVENLLRALERRPARQVPNAPIRAGSTVRSVPMPPSPVSSPRLQRAADLFARAT
jgi:hypothetical protein